LLQNKHLAHPSQGGLFFWLYRTRQLLSTAFNSRLYSFEHFHFAG
jgi:hypothetical protein